MHFSVEHNSAIDYSELDLLCGRIQLPATTASAAKRLLSVLYSLGVVEVNLFFFVTSAFAFDSWQLILSCFSTEIQHQQPPFYGHYTDRLALGGTSSLRTGGFCWCKVLLPLLMAKHIRIREKMLEFSSAVLSTLLLCFI